MSEEVNEIIELVEEATKPGTFNILAALKDRAYPRVDVSVYFDESNSYKASVLQERIKEIEEQDVNSGFNLTDAEKEELASLISKRDDIIKQIEKEKYVFKIVGISEGVRDDLYKRSTEVYPIEHEETKNPFTGEAVKVEKENPERDYMLTGLLWKEHIESIVAPDGSEQKNITDEDISALRRSLPLASIAKITENIEKLRISTAMFMLKVDEDFLAKS